MPKKTIVAKRIKEAREVLKNLGLPLSQQNEISALTLLALCGIKPNDLWDNSYRHSLTVSKGIIEVVTSHGPMSHKRVVELEAMLEGCAIGKIFVTAFPNFAEFRKHTPEIAWETEVWIAENPDHLIHYNGDKFLGPR